MMGSGYFSPLHIGHRVVHRVYTFHFSQVSIFRMSLLQASSYGAPHARSLGKMMCASIVACTMGVRGYCRRSRPTRTYLLFLSVAVRGVQQGRQNKAPHTVVARTSEFGVAQQSRAGRCMLFGSMVDHVLHADAQTRMRVSQLQLCCTLGCEALLHILISGENDIKRLHPPQCLPVPSVLKRNVPSVQVYVYRDSPSRPHGPLLKPGSNFNVTSNVSRRRLLSSGAVPVSLSFCRSPHERFHRTGLAW